MGSLNKIFGRVFFFCRHTIIWRLFCAIGLVACQEHAVTVHSAWYHNIWCHVVLCVTVKPIYNELGYSERFPVWNTQNSPIDIRAKYISLNEPRIGYIELLALANTRKTERLRVPVESGFLAMQNRFARSSPRMND